MDEEIKNVLIDVINNIESKQELITVFNIVVTFLFAKDKGE